MPATCSTPILYSLLGSLIVLLSQLCPLLAPIWAAESSQEASPTLPETPAWSQVRAVQMQGDLRTFWNVGGGDVTYNNREALAHGFRLVNLLGTYADYPGKQKENINHALKDNRTNPWKKPDYFERIIRRNIARAGRDGEIMVHDIEFDFEQDADKAWEDVQARTALGAATKEQFAEAYYREWATWFSLPCQWPFMPCRTVGMNG